MPLLLTDSWSAWRAPSETFFVKFKIAPASCFPENARATEAAPSHTLQTGQVSEKTGGMLICLKGVG